MVFDVCNVFGWADFGSGPLMASDPLAGVQPLMHFSHPDTKRRAHELIEVSGLIKHLQRIPGRPATREEITSVHTEEYHDRIKALSDDQGGHAGDGITTFGKNGYVIAAMATGTALEMTEKVVKGELRTGYANGHHAEPDTGRGFCIFNNTAISAQYAVTKLGLKKVAIVDFDVHHGNGAQKAFWNRRDILTISVHQDQYYPPDSGFTTEIGEGEGKGFNFNVPVPAGSTNKTYELAFDEAVIPALRAFKPELILVAAGQDPNIMDPLSATMVTAKGFRSITRRLLKAADELTGGKIVFIQEGGYSPAYIPICTQAIVEEMAGQYVLKADPYHALIGHYEDWEVTDAQREMIGLATANIKGLSA